MGKNTHRSSSSSSPSTSSNNKKNSKLTKYRLSSQLRAALSDLAMRICEVDADGNCLYRALDDQCNNRYGHDTIRAHVADYIESHASDFAPYAVGEDAVASVSSGESDKADDDDDDDDDDKEEEEEQQQEENNNDEADEPTTTRRGSTNKNDDATTTSARKETKKTKKLTKEERALHRALELYVQRLREDGTWGGNLEVVAAAKLLRRRIVIHQEDGPTYEVAPEGNPTDASPLHLSFHDNSHYNSVRPFDDRNHVPGALPEHDERESTSASRQQVDNDGFQPSKLTLARRKKEEKRQAKLSKKNGHRACHYNSDSQSSRNVNFVEALETLKI